MTVYRMSIRPRALMAWLAALAGSLMFIADAQAGAGPINSGNGAKVPNCADVIEIVEARSGIPAQLLSAIALAESGRWDAVRRKSVSWPWAIYAEGRAYYPQTKDDAVAKARALMERGVRNIDVGCLQINLFYHPDAFDDLEQAFDPLANTTYAADFLVRLQNTHRSWSRAIAYYHSANRKFAIPYLRRVQKLWLAERRREATELRDARLEALRVKKAEREAAAGQLATN